MAEASKAALRRKLRGERGYRMRPVKRVANREGYELLGLWAVRESQLAALQLDAPLTSAFVLARCQCRFLVAFNRRKQRWELPGGIMEPGETPRQCAVRELREETSQTPSELRFEGLMKLRLSPANRIEYSALFSCQVDSLAPFQINDEIEAIALWDGNSDIGYVEEISRALIELNGGS